MDRILVSEFPPLLLVADTAKNTKWVDDVGTEYTPIANTNNQYWFSENKLDLSGYTMDDLTVYFRNSFEQTATAYTLGWKADTDEVVPFDTIFIETTIVSSIPITPNNLLAIVFGAPGFIPLPTALEVGTFNRTHIIHGTSLFHGPDTSFGSDSLAKDGGAYARLLDNVDFSSLEPTAAEKLYCYRVLYLPEAYDDTLKPNALNFVNVPAKRVILNTMIDKEPDLEYLFRLKRSYELANQV